MVEGEPKPEEEVKAMDLIYVKEKEVLCFC